MSVMGQKKKIRLVLDTNWYVSATINHKDNYLLGLCIDGKADYLITGDADLLVLKQIGETKILTLNEFIHHKHRLF